MCRILIASPQRAFRHDLLQQGFLKGQRRGLFGIVVGNGKTRGALIGGHEVPGEAPGKLETKVLLHQALHLLPGLPQEMCLHLLRRLPSSPEPMGRPPPPDTHTPSPGP